MTKQHGVSRIRWAVLSSAVALWGVAPVPPATAAAATPTVSLLAGTTPTTTVFPNNLFTVADAHQLTGRRISLPVPQCTAATRSICDAAAILNQLDGFDLQPRVTLPFSGPIDVSSVTPTTVHIDGPDGSVGLGQLVWDPATNTLAGIATDLLREDTSYTIVVTDGVLDTSGSPVDVCGAGCHARSTTFVTESATTELDRIRRSLDSGAAYRQAGITDRTPQFVQNGIRDVFAGPSVLQIQRNDQVSADPTKPLVTSMVPDFAQTAVGELAFGSFLSPQFVTTNAVIPHVATRRTPRARSAARLGFALIVPAGTPPAGGWPVAVYGPGFTRSHYDLFVTSDLNAANGVATLATDPLGHDFGPLSSTTITTAQGATTFLSYGRGHDLDGDGAIANNEGVSPTDHKTFRNGVLVKDTPSPNQLVGLRDGLIQTAADNMALVRAIEGGVDVNGDGSTVLSRTNVMYYGLSFGGIYGTMLLGTDTHVKVGFLNSGGGPIADIARLGGFRNLLSQQFAVSRPSLLNGGPGLDGFTESLPMPLDPPVTTPVSGAVLIQQYLAEANWAERSGSPESFAPLIRLRPRYAGITKHVEWQTAFGDHTVPNVTAGNIYRAGHVMDLVTYYRNDKSATSGTDPHGFLADPTLAGRQGAEKQLADFLKSGGTVVSDPSTPAVPFEVPIANPGNLNCLHYAEPQTGTGAFPPAASGECP